MRFSCSCIILSLPLLWSPLLAQPQKVITFSHPLVGGGTTLPPHRFQYSAPALPETLHILAAMVDFQKDNDDRTTGDGSFDLSDTLGRVPDAPPHNRSYFSEHLTFVQNYFGKVSKGKLIVRCDILDNVYTMPHPIAHYSPPRGSSDNTELGYLMQDAWHVVDSVTPGVINQKNYDSYIIFHAGAGRDIDLTSLFGYDPTPLDIPSVYINLASLQKMFGSSYMGVSVNGGNTLITNSMVIPETESRILPGVSGNFLYPLGINGLLCASVGSHLGLPDLFDTKTGASGIGRFGLMDGQSIFSWSGLFPPEPSAWEKIYLGWIHPITVTDTSAVVDLPAVGLNGNPDSVYRVLISEKEYFLVENRNRDANRDGATVTMMIHDSVFTQTWYRDTVGFNAYNISSLFGVITDVDEFDWSLPGGVNTDTKEWFDGGILIWHIDENIIDSTIADDAVNANPDRKGVNLMEADGSQDIGQTYDLLSPGYLTESGIPLDFWYYGNQARLRVRSNAFTPASEPGSESIDHANSHVYIDQFSPRGPHMTARIRIGDNAVSPIPGFPVAVAHGVDGNPLKIADLSGSGSGDLILATGPGKIHSGWVYGWRSDGQALDSLFRSPAPILDVALALRDVTGGGLIDPSFSSAHAGQDMTPPVILDSICLLGIGDSVYVVGVSGFQVGAALNVASLGLSLYSKSGEFVSCGRDSSVRLLTQTEVLNSAKIGHPLAFAPVVASLSIATGKRIVFGTSDGYVFSLSGDLSTAEGFPYHTGGEISNAPALADLLGDGHFDIIVCSDNKIYALNPNGVPLDHFPITTPSSQPLLAAPIVADVNGDGLPDIVTVTQEGLVLAYDRTGKMLNGFPLLAGFNHGSTPVVLYLPSICLSCTDIGLAVASDDGHVYAWRTGTLRTGLASAPAQPWPQVGLDALNSSYLDTTISTHAIYSGFFPGDRAYNWPNPVDRSHGFKTHIRYFVSTNATVEIKVFDLAGDLVAEFAGPGQGGLDNEVEWDVSHIQSGVYFAHIDAQGSGGHGSAVIKIAVVK